MNKKECIDSSRVEPLFYSRGRKHIIGYVNREKKQLEFRKNDVVESTMPFEDIYKAVPRE